MDKKKIGLLAAATVACMLSLIAMLVVLTNMEPDVRVEFTPPPFEAAAQTGTPEVPEELGWGEVDAQLFKAWVCGKLIPEGDSVDIWLTNPEDSGVWLKLRALDADGNLLGETGLLRPGEYVRSVALETVPPEGTTLYLKLMTYEPDTYHSAGATKIETKISSAEE